MREFSGKELGEIALGLKLLEVRRRMHGEDYLGPRALKEEFRAEMRRTWTDRPQLPYYGKELNDGEDRS